MVQLRDAATVSGPTTSDGIVILTVQRASGPHPHPAHEGRIVPFNHVSHLLLANGEERFRCDWPTPNGPNPTCGKDTFTEVKQVPAHMASHTADRTGSRYPEETLRYLIRLVRTYQRAGHTDYNRRTAAELNRQFDRYPTWNGEPWTPERVKVLFARYHADFRTHVRQVQVDRVRLQTETQRTTTTTVALGDDDFTEDIVPTPAPSVTGAVAAPEDRVTLAELDRRAAQLNAEFAELESRIRKHRVSLNTFTSDLVDVVRELASRPDADPEIVAQAAKWRQAQELFGGR